MTQPPDPREGERRRLIDELSRRRAQGVGTPIEGYPDLDRAERVQDSKLKKVYGYTVLTILVAEFIVVNSYMFIYAVEHDWNVPVDLIKVWLGATVAQLVGLSYVVTRYLFPDRRDSN